jgi:hypothetical protein
MRVARQRLIVVILSGVDASIIFILMMAWVFIGKIWVSDPLYFSTYVIGCVLITLIISFLVTLFSRWFKKRNIRTYLGRFIIYMSLCMFVFLFVIGLEIHQGIHRNKKFSNLFESVYIGMCKADVEKLLNGYIIDCKTTRLYIRSLPQESRTHICIKDAYVDFDKNEKVINKEIFSPTT